MKDYYYILGTERNASDEELKMAYRKLSRKFHPDANNGDKFYEKRFKEIVEAFEVLSDQKKRSDYNRELNNFYDHFNNYKNQSYRDSYEYYEEDLKSETEEKLTFYQKIEEKVTSIKKALKIDLRSLNKNRTFFIAKRLTFLVVLVSSLFVFSMFTGFNSDVLKGISNNDSIEEVKEVEENFKNFGMLKDQFKKGEYKQVAENVEKINSDLLYCNSERNQYEAVSIISYFKLGDWNSLKRYENNFSAFDQLIDNIGKDSKSSGFMGLRGCNDGEESEILIEKGIAEKIKNSLELKPDFLQLVKSEITKDKDVQKKGFNQVAVYLQFNKKWRLSIYSKLIEIDSSISLSFYESEIEKVALEQLSYKYNDLEKKEESKKIDINSIYDPYKVLSPVNLKNGDSPFSKCFKEGIDKRNNSRLIVHNQSKSDMVFLLKDVKSGKIIRNEYINAKTNYKLRYIPNGEYKMIQIYGDCWIDKNDIKYSCGEKGMFTKDVWYAIPEKDNGIISIPQCGKTYTVIKAYLNPIANGKLKVKFPAEEEIFNDNKL